MLGDFKLKKKTLLFLSRSALLSIVPLELKYIKRRVEGIATEGKMERIFAGRARVAIPLPARISFPPCLFVSHARARLLPQRAECTASRPLITRPQC